VFLEMVLLILIIILEIMNRKMVSFSWKVRIFQKIIKMEFNKMGN
jgi:hypothetical protein